MPQVSRGRSCVAGLITKVRLVVFGRHPCGPAPSTCSTKSQAMRDGGSCFAEDGGTEGSAARLFWDPHLDSTVIVARARPAAACDERSFDIYRQAAPVVHLSLVSAGEELLIGRGANNIRLSIVEGTLLDGPVVLHFQLDGADQLDRNLAPLARLAHYLRHGRITAPKPRTDQSVRRGQVLQVLDGLAMGASHRDIASALRGTAAVERDWDGPSDHMRSRTRRLITRARRLMAGGYLDLLAARTRLSSPYHR